LIRAALIESQCRFQSATYSVAFDALDGVLVMVAANADWLTLMRDERTGADRAGALRASETVFMPLLRLVEVLLRTFNTHPVEMCPESYSKPFQLG